MNTKLTVYLTLILAIAIITVIFVINPRHNAEKQMEDKRVFHIKTGDIEKIAINNKNGDFSIVRSSANEWKIVSPVYTDADVNVINNIISSIDTLNYEKKIGTGSLIAFGLSPASITATVTSGDNKSYTIMIGSATPIGPYYYAMAENGIQGIFTINDWLKKQLDANLFQLRDKKLVNLSQNDLVAIAFTVDNKPVYALKKENDIWIFTKPGYNRVKTAILNDIAFQLTNLNATNILDNIADLKSTGLEKPSEVISISLMTGKQYTIKLGNTVDQNSIYAIVSGKKPVYVISRSIISAFDKPVNQMIDKRLLLSDSFAISSIEIISNGKEVKLTKKAFNQWDKNGVPFTNVSYINSLLDALTSLKAESFISNPSALKTPAYTFTVTSSVNPTSTTILISDPNKKPVYARTSIDPRLSVLNSDEVSTLEKSMKQIYQ